MHTSFQIAIDGPVAAGKGTISKLVADRLNFLYVDTGAMYRVTTLLALSAGVALTDVPKLVEITQNAEILMHNPTEDEKDGRLTTVIVNGEDVSWQIRTEKVSSQVSLVAQLAEVRAVLVEKQKLIAQSQNVVMEGRDITYRVLPDAQFKIYLTGSDLVRAKRRHQQLLTRGEDITYEEVYRELVQRDKNDIERSVDPLTIVPEAWVIDTSDLKIQQVVELIVTKATVMLQG